MKKKSSHQQQTNREAGFEKSVDDSLPGTSSSANKTREDDVNMPDGAETDFKDGLLDTKQKQVKGSLSKRTK
jgi:hypothetical protein